MSQSDYISTKKKKALLRLSPDPVLQSHVYTTLKGFALERKIITDFKPKTVYNRMALSGKVFQNNIETNYPKTCEKDLCTYLRSRNTGTCQNCSFTARNPFHEYRNKLKQLSYETPEADIIQRHTEKEFCQCDVYFSHKKSKQI